MRLVPRLANSITEERANHRPGEADSGLLVAHQAMPPGQAIEQVAGAPQAASVVLLRTAGFTDEFGHGETVSSEELGVRGHEHHHG